MKITDRVKWSPEYKNAMNFVEFWVLLNILYYEHNYNGRRLTQLQQQFPHVTSDINEVDILTGL